MNDGTLVWTPTSKAQQRYTLFGYLLILCVSITLMACHVAAPTSQKGSVYAPSNTPQSWFLRDTNFSTGHNLIEVDESLGEGSVNFSQFDFDSRLFIGRKFIDGDSGHRKLVLAELRGTSSGFTFHYVRDLYNPAANSAKIHDNKVQLETAYDPSLVWYRGTYWMAFECYGTSGAYFVVPMNVSTCMGPLDQNNQLIVSKTRVIALGGQPPNNHHVYSASVPKLYVNNDKLFLAWTVVKIDTRDSHLNNIAAIATQDAIDSQAGINHYSTLLQQYRDFLDEDNRTHNGSVLGYTPYANIHEIHHADTTQSPSSFYEWQTNVLNVFSRGFKYDYDTKLGVPVKNQVLPYRFKTLQTYGDEVHFTSAGVPYIGLAQQRASKVAYAWEAPHYTPVLEVDSGDSSQSILADVADIKKISGKTYYTAGLGGMLTASSASAEKKQLPCVAPTVGYSDKGCYRLGLFEATATGNIVNLRDQGVQKDVGITELTQETQRAIPRRDYNHEYARFFVLPGVGSVLTARFMKDSGEKIRYYRLQGSIERPYIKKSSLDRILQGQHIGMNTFLMSQNGRFTLSLTRDGIILYDREVAQIYHRIPLALNTGSILKVQQSDGHLVLYSTPGSSSNIWATHKYNSGYTNVRLVMQNDGNLVQYGTLDDQHNKVIYQSNTRRVY